MSIQLFSFAKLAELDDGQVAKQLDKLMAECIADCRNRPGDDSDRVLSMAMKISPVREPATGALDGVQVSFEIASKVPKRRTRSYSMGVKQTGTPWFNTSSPGDPLQRTFDEPPGPRALPDDPEDDDER